MVYWPWSPLNWFTDSDGISNDLLTVMAAVVLATVSSSSPPALDCQGGQAQAKGPSDGHRSGQAATRQ